MSRFRRRTFVALGAAAALIAAVALPFMLRTRDRGVVVSYRGGGIQALAPIGSVTEGAAFEWWADVSAAAFRIDIGDATGVFDSEMTTDTKLTPAAWKVLLPGIDYWWTVTALDRSGRPVATSARQAFRVRPH